MKKYHRVTFLPENKKILVEDRKTIFETIKNENPQEIQLRFACGAEGICQKCKVRTLQQMGPLTPTEKGCLSHEELLQGFRLACQARVIQATQVEIIYKNPFSIKILHEGSAAKVQVNPRVKKIYIRANQGEGLSREAFMAALLDNQELRLNAAALTKAIRPAFYSFFQGDLPGCTAVFMDGSLVALEEGDTSNKKYGAALDLGINTLMMSLIDLTDGRRIAEVSDTNPQMQVDPDIALRVGLAEENPSHLAMLNEEILLRIDMLLLELCRAIKISPTLVYEIIVSGSMSILSLIMRELPDLVDQQLSFKKRRVTSFWASAAVIKSCPHAKIHLLPFISQDLGADVTAGILATRQYQSKKTVLFLDLGTRGKVVLKHQGKLLASSISGGDAFECIGVKFGMRPETGAIERVSFDQELRIAVIGESLPRGICGSGLIELIGGLVRLGLINRTGDFVDSAPQPGIAPGIIKRILSLQAGKSFLLYSDNGAFQNDICINQEDVYALMRSKAYIAATVALSMNHLGVSFKDVDQVLIGGAFGYSIDPEAFIAIGLVPPQMKGRIFFAGNTAKTGAEMALLDSTILKATEKIPAAVSQFDPLEVAHFERTFKKFLNFL